MQSKSKYFRSMSGSPLLIAAASLLWLPGSTGALAQSADVVQTASAATAVIPQQVRFTGTLANHTANVVEAVFRIYATAEGGEPMWTETQQVVASADGSYSVLLGAASQSGLPQAVFAAGQARWVGVSLDRAAELPRSPLASVAYAMKAGDAETVGGVAVGTLATKDDLAKLAVTNTAAVQAQVVVQPETTPSGTGTLNYVPLWTGTSTLGNSNLFQATNGFMGIGTTTPGGPLQLSTAASGGANATMMLTQTSTAAGNYYADIGLYNSNGLIGNLSALGSGYPTGQLFGPNDVVFLGGQQHAASNLIFVTNTSGALKFGTGGYGTGNERLRIGATGGVSIGNSYVGTDPGSGSLIVSGNAGIGTTAPGAKLEVNGTAKFDGLVTFASGQTFPGGGGGGTITGITTTSPLTGSGTSGTVALGLNTTALGTTLETTYDARYALLSGGDGFAKYVQANSNTGPGYAALLGFGSSGSIGTYGYSDTSYGVEGGSASAQGVVGTVVTPAVGSEGVLGYTGGAFSSVYATEATRANSGVWGDTSSSGTGIPVGVFGTSDTGYAGVFINSSTTAEALLVRNNTGSAASITALTTGDGLDVTAVAGNGVYAINETPTDAQAGVQGVATNGSSEGANVPVYAGVWGDSGVDNDTIPDYAVGVLGTEDNGVAGFFVNNSSFYSTLYVLNQGAGPTGQAHAGPFNTFMATSGTGTCGIGGGSMSCTGPIKSLVSAGGGSRTVETYAMQSPENWMEDFGSGSMVNGHAAIQLDAAFAETVSGDASYKVFITPNGDSKGLYVTAKTSSGFEVQESGGGTSTLSFDYRIVAKRAGYEASRMVDVTESFNQETSKTRMAKVPVKPRVRVRTGLEVESTAPHRMLMPPPAPRKMAAQTTAAPAHAVENK